jgi:hypothetical protein
MLKKSSLGCSWRRGMTTNHVHTLDCESLPGSAIEDNDNRVVMIKLQPFPLRFISNTLCCNTDVLTASDICCGTNKCHYRGIPDREVSGLGRGAGSVSGRGWSRGRSHSRGRSCGCAGAATRTARGVGRPRRRRRGG